MGSVALNLGQTKLTATKDTHNATIKQNYQTLLKRTSTARPAQQCPSLIHFSKETTTRCKGLPRPRRRALTG